MKYVLHKDYVVALLTHSSLDDVHYHHAECVRRWNAMNESQYTASVVLAEMLRFPEDDPARVATETFLHALLEASTAEAADTDRTESNCEPRECPTSDEQPRSE